MKSIVEEASSLAKAIEKGWIRAGKPQEFTVKVFEEAQKNFFGFTTKSAKVGIFFEDRPQQKQKERQPQQQQQQKKQPQQAQQPRQERTDKNTQQPRQDRAPQQQKQQTVQPQQAAPKKDATPWTNDLVQAAHEWASDSLALLGQSEIRVSTEVNSFALKLNFSKPVAETPEKEKMLFKSWAYLIMQTLRQKYKRPLKGLKVILTSNA